MNPLRAPRRSGALARDREVARRLADAFVQVGWKVDGAPRGGRHGTELRVRRRGLVYAVEVKAGSEGRPDRLVPLLAQAVLQAARRAGGEATPLAVVATPSISPHAAEQVLDFAREYAPGVSVGVVDFEGFRAFLGPHFEQLNARPPERPAEAALPRREGGHLFSDLNQWMLKVLLAPELPEAMLSAPRGRYRNASELARAADVSVMSAFRLVRRLRDEGYLHESAPRLGLVRRDHLFHRWQASAVRSAEEVPMRFLLPGDTVARLRAVLARGRACLALYAAADALRLGHVEGLPPHVYVERFPTRGVSAGDGLRPCTPGEAPHFIFRKAPAPQSVFRGVVRPAGVPACDALQVWLDVAADPARGREQAELIRRTVLQKVIAGRP